MLYTQAARGVPLLDRGSLGPHIEYLMRLHGGTLAKERTDLEVVVELEEDFEDDHHDGRAGNVHAPELTDDMSRAGNDGELQDDGHYQMQGYGDTWGRTQQGPIDGNLTDSGDEDDEMREWESGRQDNVSDHHQEHDDPDHDDQFEEQSDHDHDGNDSEYHNN
jgi:hypothetical protein